RRELRQIGVEGAGREHLQDVALDRVGADDARIGDGQDEVRGPAARDHDGRPGSAVPGGQANLVAVRVQQGDAGVAEQRARAVSDVAELYLEEGVTRRRVTGLSGPQGQVRRGTLCCPRGGWRGQRTGGG